MEVDFPGSEIGCFEPGNLFFQGLPFPLLRRYSDGF
jgi:hypothetical protein